MKLLLSQVAATLLVVALLASPAAAQTRGSTLAGDSIAIEL